MMDDPLMHALSLAEAGNMKEVVPHKICHDSI